MIAVCKGVVVREDVWVITQTFTDGTLSVCDLFVLTSKVLDVEQESCKLIHSCVLLTWNFHAVTPKYSKCTIASNPMVPWGIFDDGFGHSNACLWVAC